MIRSLIAIVFLIIFHQSSWGTNIVELQLQEKLDEMRGFCIDIRGYKARAKIKRGLQAHSCYSYQGKIAVDQAFDRDLLKQGSFYMPAFDVCMEAEGHFKNAKLILNQCTEEDSQKFELTEDGQVMLMAEPRFCVAVAGEKSQEGGGGTPPHLKRALLLQECTEVEPKYGIWKTNEVE